MGRISATWGAVSGGRRFGPVGARGAAGGGVPYDQGVSPLLFLASSGKRSWDEAPSVLGDFFCSTRRHSGPKRTLAPRGQKCWSAVGQGWRGDLNGSSLPSWTGLVEAGSFSRGPPAW